MYSYLYTHIYIYLMLYQCFIFLPIYISSNKLLGREHQWLLAIMLFLPGGYHECSDEYEHRVPILQIGQRRINWREISEAVFEFASGNFTPIKTVMGARFIILTAIYADSSQRWTDDVIKYRWECVTDNWWSSISDLWSWASYWF